MVCGPPKYNRSVTPRRDEQDFFEIETFAGDCIAQPSLAQKKCIENTVNICRVEIPSLWGDSVQWIGKKSVMFNSLQMDGGFGRR